MISIQIFNLNNYINKSRLLKKYPSCNFFTKELTYSFVIEIISNIEIQIIKHDKQIYLNNKNCLIFFNNISEVINISISFADYIKNEIEICANNYFLYSNRIEKFNNDSKLGNDAKSNLFSIMGILNVTPDSFSDGGKYLSLEDAYLHFKMLHQNGADIIDIGGESSRPGAAEISVDEEINRTLPLINKIITENPDVIISIDTKKAKVAEQALLSGVKIVNDISGFEYDKNMLDVLIKYKPIYVLMHMKGIPLNMQDSPVYDDPVKEIIYFFKTKIKILNEIGISNIILDPGIGFGKRLEDNLEIISRLDEFKILGYPIMIGLSKKRFLGNITNSSVSERDIETIIMETIAVNNGASFIRTHEVENCKKLKLLFNHYKYPIKNG